MYFETFQKSQYVFFSSLPILFLTAQFSINSCGSPRQRNQKIGEINTTIKNHLIQKACYRRQSILINGSQLVEKKKNTNNNNEYSNIYML